MGIKGVENLSGDLPPIKIHTIPVPEGWSIEQAWEAISRGEKLPEEIGSWASIEVDENEALVKVIFPIDES